MEGSQAVSGPLRPLGSPRSGPGFSIISWDVTLPHPPCLSLPSRDRPKPLAKEGTSDPPSPLLLPSPGGWKAITEKPPGGHEEAEEDHQGAGLQGEGTVGTG